MRRDLLLIGLFAGAFVAITAGLAAGGPLIELDLALQRLVVDHRPPAAETLARALNRLGQGVPLLVTSLVLAGWLSYRSRTTLPMLRSRLARLGPVLYVLAAAVLMVPSVLAMKAATERGAPSSELPAEQTVQLFGPLPEGEYAAGYPGGHAVNTVVWYGVILLLATALRRSYGRTDPPRPVRVVFRLAPVLIVLATTTYLSYHWFTDSLAGIAFGLLVDRILHLLRPVTVDAQILTPSPSAPQLDG